MTEKILIVDASKASLVMTSEILKDSNADYFISTAPTGQKALEKLVTMQPDLCIIDFDLPDVDGSTLVSVIRETWEGPILMTAFANSYIDQAVREEVFCYNDASDWVAKPVDFNELVSKVECYMINKSRLVRRFDSDLNTLLVGKASGRGKRAPKTKGHITNLSLGGVKLELENLHWIKQGTELVVNLPELIEPLLGKPCDCRAEQKYRASVAWLKKDDMTAGLKFEKLTQIQQKGLFRWLKACDS